MEEAKGPPIKIAPKGSMVSKESLETAVRKSQAAEERLKQAQDDKTEDAKKKVDEEREKLINDLLPKTVVSAFGEIPFDQFKEVYQSVWDQVRDKAHLVRGYCIYETEVSPGLSVRIRTFKAGENRMLQHLNPGPNAEYGQYMTEHFQLRHSRLAIAITQFDGQELPDVGEFLVKNGVDEWEKDEAVQGRMKWLDGLPEEFVAHISGLLVDVTQAYRLAVQENLKNRLAPLSPSIG